jgi:hypothetical protein
MINALLTRIQSVGAGCLDMKHLVFPAQMQQYSPRRFCMGTVLFESRGKMKQTQSVKLHTYWKKLYAESGVPERSQIEPMAIRKILGDTFILEFAESNVIRYRLAGTRLCAMFGRELKGQNFSEPWQNDGQETITDIIKAATREASIAVFGSTATSKSGREVSIETLILPLLYNGQNERRMLGVTSPISRPYWLGADPIVSLSLSSLRIIEPKRESQLINSRFTMLSNSNPDPLSSICSQKKVKHLTVLEGGLSNNSDTAQV